MPIEAVVFDAYGTLFDVQSVAGAAELAFPGHGHLITQLWRMKQLEYSWLRALMGRYEDFATVTRESLAYSLRSLGLPTDAAQLDRLAEAYDMLAPYQEAGAALNNLAAYRLAVLSNGTSAMLHKLIAGAQMAGLLEAVLSVDEKRTYKPDPRCYALVEERLGVAPTAVLFVTSNGFDAAGAKSFGFKVARIERVKPAALQEELKGKISADIMYKALRSQVEQLGDPPDYVIDNLLELAPILNA